MHDNYSIGIVDDHSMVRKGLAALIALFPRYRVIFDTGSGDACVANLKAGQVPDILLLDIMMPGMDGYAVASWVKDHQPEMRILALTTMDSETAILRMIRSGARGYLLKDAEPAELKTAFDDVISLGYYYNELVSRKILRNVRELADDVVSPSALVKLSDREAHFLKLACSEKTYAEIAREMFVSERTVDGYRDSLFKKLGVTTRVGLVLYAIRNNLATP